jgi:branched-chain amino acid transport system substrate-binding protein
MKVVRQLTGLFSILSLAHLASAQAAEPIKIGLILPYTGVFASLSEDETRGFMMAVDEMGGKIGGRPIVVVKGDSELKPNVALQQLNKLVNSDKVDLVVGGSSSSEAFALRDALVKQKKPFVIIQATSDSLTRELCSTYVVRTSYSATAFESAAGRWLASKVGKKAFTIAPDYSAGQEIIGSFAKGFEEGGGKIVGQAWPPFRTTKDYGPFLVQAKESGADFLYVFFGGGEAIQAVKQHADFGLKAKLPM